MLLILFGRLNVIFPPREDKFLMEKSRSLDGYEMENRFFCRFFTGPCDGFDLLRVGFMAQSGENLFRFLRMFRHIGGRCFGVPLGFER